MTPEQEQMAIMRNIIWLLVHRAGGRVAIKDSELHEITLDHTVVMFRDDNHRKIVLTATVDKPANAN